METGAQSGGHEPRVAVRRLSPAQQWRALLIAAAVLAGLALLVIAGRWLFTTTPPEPKPLPRGELRLTREQMAGVALVRAGTTDDLDRTSATGQIAVDDTLATPVFMPYSGQVSDVLVEAGALVSAGQPLLKVRTGDVVDARNALIAATAQRATAEAQLKLAQGNVARQEQIYKTAGGALKDYQQAQNDLVTAQSALRNADSAVGVARDKLAIFGKSPSEINGLEHNRDVAGIHPETVLHAPISGLVAQRAVAPGQYVTAGGTAPVFTIANQSRVWLVAQLAESDAPHVQLGDRAEVTVPALPGRMFHAQVDNVAAALDPASHRLPVRVTLPNPDGALKPQMFANFTITHPADHAAGPAGVSIPAAAVIHEGDTARVWVVIGPDLLQARNVRVGDSGNGMVRVVAGLRPGEQVVSKGSIFVNEAGLGE